MFRKYLNIDIGVDMTTALSLLSLNGLKSETENLTYNQILE